MNPDTGPLAFDGLTLSPDPTRLGRYFHAPTAPSLATGPDGEPKFGLTLFRGLQPDRAVASLLLGVDLVAAPAAVASARGALSQSPSEVVLEPLPHFRGGLRLEAPGLPALSAPLAAGQRRAYLAGNFDGPAAKLLDMLIRRDPSACGVVFDLTSFAARPGPAWTIRADWTRIGAQLAERAAAGGTVSAAQIRALVVELIDAGAARLHFDPAWGEPDAAAPDEVYAWLAELVTAHYFDVRYGPGPAPAFTFRPDRPAPDDAAVNARAVERHAYGQAGLDKLLTATGRPLDAFVRMIDLDDTIPAPVSVQLVCDRLGTAVDAVRVDLEYGRGDLAERRSVTLQSPQDWPKVRWRFDPDAGRTYRYSVHGTYRPASGGQPISFDASPATGDQAILMIVPPD